MPKNFNLVLKNFNLVPKKIKISAKKIQKITNRVDWILSRRVYDVITMLTASTKIPKREGSISPSRFYGQLPDD